MIYTALIQYLKANLSVTRVYGNYAPQDTVLPAVIVDLDAVTVSRHHAQVGAASGLKSTEFEISVFADTQLAATQLADEITTLLQNGRATMSDGLSPQTLHRVADITVNSEASGFDGSVEHFSHSLFISVTHS